MGSSRRHNLNHRIRRSNKSGDGDICMKGSHAKFKCTLVEVMSHQRLLYISVRLFILSGLWSSRFDALGQDRFTDEGAMVVRRVAVESLPHERTSRLPAEQTESIACSAVEAGVKSGNVDDTPTAPASAPIRQPQLAAATIPSETGVVTFISQLLVQDDRIHREPHHGRHQDSTGRPAGKDTAQRRRREGFFATRAHTADGSKTESGSHSNNGIVHISSEKNNMFTSGTRFDVSSLAHDISPESYVRDGNSNLSVSGNTDASRTPGESLHYPGLAAGEPGPQEPQRDNYYHEQCQIAHDHRRQSQQDEIYTELQRGEKLSYKPQKQEYPLGDTALDDGYYNNVENGDFPLYNVYTLHQRPQAVRFLAAEAGSGFPSVPVENQKVLAHQMMPLAAGTTDVPDIEKQALALLSGIWGRNSGTRHWGYPESEFAVPQSFPHYYSTLTPQHMHVLANQQHFHPHPSAQHLLPGPEDHQQQQLLQSHVHRMHQYQQPQQNYRGAMVAPLYIGPQRVSTGMGRHPRDCCNFSRDQRLSRQRQRLQRQQLHQLFPHHPHPLHLRYMNTLPSSGTYAGTAALYPTASLATLAPGAADRYIRVDDYISIPTVNSGYTPPHDPNLLPLQHRQQSAEGMRLEAQLRNQHDAWRARERFSL